MAQSSTRMDRVAIEAALEEADLRVLLMVLFHMTGDERWLTAPFLPKRDVQLIADEAAGLSMEVQHVIRAAALDVLCDSEMSPAIQDPGDDQMLVMMRVCLGETVPAEYAPMMREQMGFVPLGSDIAAPTASSTPERRPVLIAGAGVSGIALGALLNKLTIPFIIAEKNAEVGGTWWENRYPGCGVDTPNHAYSFSFGPRYPWSRYFAPQSQIQDYLERSATETSVRPHVRFGTEITQASWDETKSCWRVTLNSPTGEEEIEAMALVSAVGQLSLPSIPDIEGANDFAGDIFHSARWPEGMPLNGRKVAIIGTGASAMQIAPTIADEVESLTIYQRSAQWARPIPRYHDPISDNGQWLLEHVPFYAAWFRFTMFWRYGDGLLPFLHKDPEWPHPERSLNKVNDRHRQEMTDHITASLKARPELIEKCLPTYPPYGKRILLDNGWYETLLKPNVELVTEDVARISKDGVESVDGTHRDADIIILATGFQVGQMAARLNITGRDGQSLAKTWAPDNPSAYLGITVPGFPNLFCMQGPNTGLGHGGSAMFTAECQATYIADCLAMMLREGVPSLEVKQEAHDTYVTKTDAEHEKMIWTHPGMSTYYRNSLGRVFSVMPWRLVDFWTMTRRADTQDFMNTPRA